MPNTVVKLIYAESTWPEAAREDRKLLIKRISRESVRFFLFLFILASLKGELAW